MNDDNASLPAKKDKFNLFCNDSNFISDDDYQLSKNDIFQFTRSHTVTKRSWDGSGALTITLNDSEFTFDSIDYIGTDTTSISSMSEDYQY